MSGYREVGMLKGVQTNMPSNNQAEKERINESQIESQSESVKGKETETNMQRQLWRKSDERIIL